MGSSRLRLIDGYWYVDASVKEPETGKLVRVRRSTGCVESEKAEAKRLVHDTIERGLQAWKKKNSKKLIKRNDREPEIRSVAQAVDAYARAREAEKGWDALKRDQYYLKLMKREFGGRKLENLEGWEVLRVLEGRGIKTGSQRRAATVMRAVMNWAKARGGVTFFEYDKMPAEGEGRTRWITAEQRDRLLGIAWRKDRELWRLLVILFETGGRLGCVRNLKWQDVRMVPGVATLDQDESVTLYTRKGSGKKRYYKVPITQVAKRVLDQTPERERGPDQWVFPTFCDEVFGPKEESAFYKRWYAVRRATGLKDFKLHDARHTFATLLARSGKVSLPQLMDLLGHTTLAMTMRYAHHIPVNEVGVSSALRVNGRDLPEWIMTDDERDGWSWTRMSEASPCHAGDEGEQSEALSRSFDVVSEPESEGIWQEIWQDAGKFCEDSDLGDLRRGLLYPVEPRDHRKRR